MADRTVFTSAEFSVARDTVTGDVTVYVWDASAQCDRRYVIPEHLLPGLLDALDDAITRNPELFPLTSIRRVD